MPKHNENEESRSMHIHKWRGMRGMKQSELAKLVNISTSTLSKYENGKITPGVEQLQQIAFQLNISVKQLLKDPGETFPIR